MTETETEQRMEILLSHRVGSTLSPPEKGSLHLTTHHLIFNPPSFHSFPHSLLHSIARSPPNLTGTLYPLTLHYNNFSSLHLSFFDHHSRERVWDCLRRLCANPGGREESWAFTRAVGAGGGWALYDPKKEFLRMGLGSRTKGWRFTDINRDYQVSCSFCFLGFVFDY